METENNENTEITAENPLVIDSDPVQAAGDDTENVVSVQELLPALRDVAAENNVQLAEAVTKSVSESLPEVSDHPFMTTDFNDYSVTEGLLLLIAVLLVLNFFLTILRRWF